MDIGEIKLNDQGLIPCVAQDYADGRVLMLAYMSPESLKKTIETGKACYFSRSRNKFWTKGEESGNFQIVKDIQIDCDMDTILLKVEQKGNCSCHKGYRSCFFKKWGEKGWTVSEDKVIDPSQMYDK
ncbi:MAG: phosphoribosyl-AMP cyclohydrolase [Elusimicrobia bacterium]|nr:phosphoribosyl-AMP cyclohydrolase [Elusimicrobiota bacterium]